MKIRRYVAKDMRSALAQIKEELGAEAVIMSNKRIPEGVELMAAVDNNTQPVAPKVNTKATNDDAQQDDTIRMVENDVVNLGQTPQGSYESRLSS